MLSGFLSALALCAWKEKGAVLPSGLVSADAAKSIRALSAIDADIVWGVFCICWMNHSFAIGVLGR